MAETANKQCVEDINDCSSISADASLPEESVDSDCNERCVKLGSESPAESCYPPAKSSYKECGPVNNVNDGEHSTIRTVTEANGNEKRRPAFSITFRNRDLARKYRKAVKQFFKELIRKHEPEEDDCDASDLELDIWEDDAEENSSEHSNDNLFTIDTTPTLKDNLDIPAYDRKFSVVEQQKESEQKSALSTCFNCMGDHSLKDCPKPRDPTVINKNRREFMNKHGNYSRVSRYHLDDDQRFARFAPGEISNELSKALGLSHNQLPRHIYRMRLLGYPPGWMEDAKVSHSGLVMFDSQGQEVADPEDEEGEIVTGDSRDKYDIKKIISFPGFNVAAKPGTKDDSDYYRCPPIQDMHSKQKMLSSLQSKETRAYKRKRLLVTAKRAEKLEEPIHSQSDMEVEEVSDTVNLLPDDDCRFIPPLPKDTPPRPPPPPSTTESDSEGGECRSQEPCSPLSTGHSSLSSPRAQSPSLSDLEAKKRQLLAELEDGGSSSDNNLTQKATPTTPNLGRVKSVSLGTPILKSASPFSRLPEPEKFSKNICDVINFENLPDSTGKYEQMSGIIKKVRTVVARMHEQDE
ncbi:hypothetical protein R5R35_013835 [Gryllus longicercus]|uniref:PSP proline-rich domain-containing protein n=1 Tax=Gryllus longicercus TaxID=2509291 RepID=A0AAN9VK74_9ORTH|nr:Zinc finger CCHC domain-containing protein 8 homolog [Gryllus bimaculatus]